MVQMCCFPVSLTTRIIGTFGLSTSILMVNVLLSEYFSRESDEKFLLSVEDWTILGTNWINLMRKDHVISNVTTVLACIITYAFLSFIVNAFLILGLNMKRPSYYYPWIYLYLFIIFDQSMALTLHFSHVYYCDVYLRSPSYMRISFLYVVLCLYFWTIVYTNKKMSNDAAPSPPQTDNQAALTAVISDSNVPKSPSFVSAITNSPFVYVVKSEPTPDLPPPAYSTISEKS